MDNQQSNDAKKLFIADSSIEEHISFMRFNEKIYWTTIENIFDKEIELNSSTYSKILAICLQKNDRQKVEYLCSKNSYKLPEVLKACEILDSRRIINSLKKKLCFLEKNNCKIGKINKIKTLISNKETINEGQQYSLSGGRIKMIKNYWIKNITEDQLKFYSLSYGTKYWKYLIDLLHTKPSDFKLAWFQNYVFNGNAPDDSILTQIKKINNDNILDFINKYKPYYNYMRTIKNITFSDEAKKLMAEYTPLETILYYWTEFECNDVANIILEKIEQDIDLPYGNLLDNITKMDSYKNLKDKLLKIADNKLKRYELCLEKPVSILCDGSASMDVAIKTSAIIASILTAICGADLRVFRSDDQLIQNPPKTAEDVIMFSKYCKANNCTNPAASLYPYYIEKKEIKTFIIVTDEEENEKISGYNFCQLFKKYREEIYKAKLIFISFIKNRNNHMQMIKELKDNIPNINEDITQYTFDFNNPDLRRLDNILSQISHFK